MQDYNNYYQLGTGKFCPRCETDKVKTELKLLPNEFLLCETCQAVFRLVGNQLFQVAIQMIKKFLINSRQFLKCGKLGSINCGRYSHH